MSNKVYVTVGVDGRNIPAGGEQGQMLVKNSNDDYDFVWANVSGTSSERMPAQNVSPKDTNADPLYPSGGSRGNQMTYARQDHAHPLNVPTTGTPQKDGTGAIGNSDYYAAFNHVHPLNVSSDVTELQEIGTAALGTAGTYARTDHVHPDTGIKAEIALITPVELTVSLPAASWETDAQKDDKHTQTITVTGGTANTVVDLYPDYAVMHQMMEDGTMFIYIENTSGVFTAVAIGDKPTADLSVAARRIEV